MASAASLAHPLGATEWCVSQSGGEPSSAFRCYGLRVADRDDRTSTWPPEVPALVAAEPVNGGWVCDTRRGVLADGRQVVVKKSPYPADAEADGLRALAAAGVPVPQVLGYAGSVLVLEYVA